MKAKISKLYHSLVHHFSYIGWLERKEKRLRKVTVDTLVKWDKENQLIYYMLCVMCVLETILIIKNISQFWYKSFSIGNFITLMLFIYIMQFSFKFVRNQNTVGKRHRGFKKGQNKKFKLLNKISRFTSYSLLLSLIGMLGINFNNFTEEKIVGTIMAVGGLSFLIIVNREVIKFRQGNFEELITEIIGYQLIGGKVKNVEIGKYPFNEYSKILKRYDRPLLDASIENFEANKVNVISVTTKITQETYLIDFIPHNSMIENIKLMKEAKYDTRTLETDTFLVSIEGVSGEYSINATSTLSREIQKQDISNYSFFKKIMLYINNQKVFLKGIY